MDLPEKLGIELVEELLDRLANERLALRGHDLGVLVLGVKVEHLVDRYEAHRRAERSLDPLQLAAGLARLELGEHGREVGRWPLQARLEPLDDLGHALGRRRLEDVVDGALIEGGHRVLIVGGHEHDVTGAGHFVGDLEARFHRHADVEKRDIRLQLALQREGLLAILRLGDHGELGPGLGEA